MIHELSYCVRMSFRSANHCQLTTVTTHDCINVPTGYSAETWRGKAECSWLRGNSRTAHSVICFTGARLRLFHIRHHAFDPSTPQRFYSSVARGQTLSPVRRRRAEGFDPSTPQRFYSSVARGQTLSPERRRRIEGFDSRPSLSYLTAVPLVPHAVGIVHACVGFPWSARRSATIPLPRIPSESGT